MANSLIGVVSMAKAGSLSQESGWDLGGTEGQVFLRAAVPCGRQLSMGKEAKLRLSGRAYLGFPVCDVGRPLAGQCSGWAFKGWVWEGDL